MEKDDRLSKMPDPILRLILSKIPIQEAISCSLVSKRWRYAYTHISELNISPFLLLGRFRPYAMSMARAEDLVSNFLQLHSSHLEAFHLDNNLDPSGLSGWQFTHENVSRWLHCAASKNVQRLILCGNLQVTEIIPSTIFSCACLTSLRISDYILSNVPTDLPGRFNHLITCSLIDIKSTDESLASFIAHSPLLQSLVIKSSVGLLNPVISAPNITHLDINSDGEDYGMEILTINCPKLVTLEAAMIRNLRVNGVCFHDLSYAIRQLKMQCGSLIELQLKLAFSHWEPGPYNFSADRILEIVGTFKSLKKLSIDIQEHLQRENEEMAVPLFALLERLPNLELLHMGGIFALELARDRIPPCLSSPLANLRILRVVINNFDEKEIDVLGCLLRSTPALQIMEFYLPKKYHDALYMQFLEKMLDLRRASVQARIRNAGSSL